MDDLGETFKRFKFTTMNFCNEALAHIHPLEASVKHVE